MEKRLKYAWTLALALLLCSACGEESGPAAPQGSSDMEGYREWPLRRQVVTSSLGHGASRVYGNDVVSNYLAKVAPDGVTAPATLRYPVGAIIVKDVFFADGTLKYVAVMRKPEVVPPGATAHGGWVWSQRNTSTEADKYKTGDECLACHTRANGETFRDSVFVFPQCEGSVSCE